MTRCSQLPIRAGVFAVLAGLMVSMIPGTVAAQSAGRRGIGIVEFIDGEVTINGMPADFGHVVEFGDWVQTGPDSSVDIVFDRSNIFRLGENTVATIEIGSARQSVNLKFGSFSAVFDRLRTLTGNGTFDVVTSTTVSGVRGTTFFLRVLDRDTTYVCSCNGTLELQSPGSVEGFLHSAVQHSARYFRQDGTLVVVEVAPLIYHSDESLNAVADQIGVTIPWGSMPE
ncbi:MAG: FecR domain-containing protein [Spirochaetia bacterium]